MLDLHIRTIKAQHGLAEHELHDDDGAMACVLADGDEREFVNWFRYQGVAERAYYRAGQAPPTALSSSVFASSASLTGS